MEDLWGDPGSSGFIFYERGSVTSDLEISDSKLSRIEEKLGFSPDEAFDEYREPEEGFNHKDSHGATGTEGQTVYLEGFRDIPQSTLAHESVHGMMNQPEGSVELPGKDPWDAILYEEFVAKKAELEFKESEINEQQLRKLTKAQQIYENVKDEQNVSVEPKGLNYEVGEIADEKILDAANNYKRKRQTILAEEAADRHKEYDLGELIDPDRETYMQTVEYIKNVETQILEKHSPE